MNVLDKIKSLQKQEEYTKLHWEGTFSDYIDLIKENPKIVSSAHKRIYDMIMSYGTEEYTRNKEDLIHYKFFDDPMEDGKDAVFGLDKPLMELVSLFESASLGYGTEKRIWLLHGPVGTAKSTIARLLKKGLEAYTATDQGALYTFYWKLDDEEQECAMHEEPLNLLPIEIRNDILNELNMGRTKDIIKYDKDLCPACRFTLNLFLDRYKGDLAKALDHVVVKRLVLSERNRIGIGTYAPRDEKNSDSTELTGDINYRKIAKYGDESDPRAFCFTGELNIANRGMVEFIEILKLDVAFLYELLTASQEQVIKPKRFAHTAIDEVILSHTNNAEYKRLTSNELMEAFRDRTVKINVPYNLRYSDELKIYERDYGKKKNIGKHVAPHTLDIAAMWAVLTRLKTPKRSGLSIINKLKLYDGNIVQGYTEESIKEIMDEYKGDELFEGMTGISPRYIQDKLSNVLVNNQEKTCVNPFMLMGELKAGLKDNSLITSEEVRKKYIELIELVEKEYEDVVKKEVQHALISDENVINNLFTNYVDNLKAYTQKTKIKNKFTGKDEVADERLMRSIEEKIGISEGRKDDFRREIINYIAFSDDKKFSWDSDERLRKALEMKLFEDQKDTIKIVSRVKSVMDKESQEKIDIVKTRLIRDYGYCESCASNVLEYVASIFAKGDIENK